MSLLEEMAKAIHEEDNRATSHPIYIVEQLKSIYGIDPEYAERSIWIDPEGNEYDSDDPSMGGVSNLTRTGIKDEYVFVQPFFTEAGANKYIEENRHNLKHPRVYVESGYRNEEWKAIRRLLKSPTELDSYDKRLLKDLTRMWSEACEIARQYCPVDVGRNHIKEGIPRLAKRASDAEAERDKLRKQIEDYKKDCLNVGSIHWAFAGDEYEKPLRTNLNEKPYEELMQKIDMKIIEELSIASLVKANAELKERVEVLEMAVEYLNGEKK